MSPWRNRLARSAVTSTLATERLVVQAHPGTKVLRSFFSVQIATEPELLYDVAVSYLTVCDDLYFVLPFKWVMCQ